jgi:DNA-binding NarL/FixJ family response regulator
MKGIHIVLADEHPIVGTGVHILETVRHLFEDVAPDILLIEMNLAEELTPPFAEQGLSASSAPRVFVLGTSHHRAYVFGLLTGGPGSQLTECDALQTIMEVLHAGLSDVAGGRGHPTEAQHSSRQLEGPHGAVLDLTGREVDVLRQLTTGKSDQAIGAHLGISKSTVRYHLQNAYKKLGVQQRSEALAWSIHAGLEEAVLEHGDGRYATKGSTQPGIVARSTCENC